MKITSVTVHAVRLPLKEPFVISYETYEDMPSIIVKLETDEGIVGYGEGVPDQHVTGETWESTFESLIHYLGPAIIGEDPFNLERIHAVMDKVLYRTPTAKAAIDIACYDLIGQRTKLPVYQLLGGKYHDDLEIPEVIGIDTPENMAKHALQSVEEGYNELKIKLGQDIQHDAERLKAVRKVVGKDIKLRVDVNQGWNTSTQAITILKEVVDCNIDWIEQPTRADDLKALSTIRKQLNIPVMADEGIHHSDDLRTLISLDAVDYINIKLMKCGGIYPALKLVHQAEMADIQCVIGSMIETSIATAAGAHLSIAKRNIVANEMAGPLLFSKNIGQLDYQKTKLRLHNHPGLGLTIDEHSIQEILVRKQQVI